MKSTILIIAGVFAFLVLVFSSLGHSMIKATSDDEFCASCHEWMSPMVKAYKQDVHGGVNKGGVKASCASCHLPHDGLMSYVFTKGKNGVVEGLITVFGDADNHDWIKNRERRKDFVYSSGCKECHKARGTSKSEGKKKMHRLYYHEKYAKSEGYTKEQIANAKGLECVSCHKHVGHKDLGRILYEQKHAPIGEWEADKKDKK